MNHESIKELLFDLYDGRLAPEHQSEVESHIQGCAPCRGILDGWTQTSAVFLKPFQVESSEFAVQNVMRKIRAFDLRSENARWSVFVRWALPALALSLTGFTAALALTVQPTEVSTDALLQDGREQGALTEWVSNPPNEDQILKAVVVKP